MKRSAVVRLFALVAVLSLVGAACANDDEAEPGTGTDTGGGGATVDCATVEFGCVEVAAGAPIPLGSLNAISGDVAFLGTDINNGITLAIDYLDGTFDATDGQLLGHDVTLQQEDDGCSAEGGQAGGTALAADTGCPK
jgi:branched-chain amino acid transport system substrate-binding protein